ncbi:heavy metal translocating P-type ATPase [Aquitalea sp. FJL05]|uniref:heavy metal translocating P-type ATPase n=1 Tax=Aquitalea sp. FJL05 TaxID=2153366 RepID=UPI000F58FFA6|nr:heavy metal translocating P-type ATPase [Aquitalea sp. FJL05]RQO77620.1 heavy metal translocating P-type ATPase [Aquitalea sp. FJL05]
MKHQQPPRPHGNHEHAHTHDHDHEHGHVEQHAHQHSCGCSNATTSALAALPAAQASGTQSHTPIRILQMDCPTEEALIRNKLGTMPGVQDMEFNLMQRVLTVSHQPSVLPDILAALRSLGFEPQTGDAPPARPAQPAAWWPLALAAVAAAAAEVCSWLALPGWLAALLALAAIAICGLGTYQKGWIALRNRTLNINALMSIAVTGAVLLGQWPEAAMVMVLFTLAERIEARSLERARNAIGSLLQLTPPQAMVQQADGSWQSMDLADIAIGSSVRVAPGERIALDGVLLAGSSSVNQSAMTGESLPVEKNVGDSVYAGTLNASGSFEYRVSAAANDTMLARIIHAVEQAQGARAPTQRFVDSFARYYTPAVFLLALAVALLPPLLGAGSWHDWLYKALVLLVIACPCALVISTPVTIVSGLAAAARRGILIKGGVWLEQGRHLRWLALDKTGTITHGKPEQTDFVALGTASPADYRQLAASLAGRSDHPVSQALSRAAQADALPLLPVEDFLALPGRGIQGNIAGQNYALGNQRLLQERGHCPPELATQLAALEAQGKSVVALLNDSGALALFAVADTIKPGSPAAIAELHQLGVKTIMLSGDNQATASAIASQAGIDVARGNQLPQDKADAIAALSGQGLVGMVGDGINDAPALARADIGFAMGAMGSDTAIETADVALMDDDLAKIPAFVRLSRTTHAILVQNITLALGIKAVFLLLTLLGMGSMWMAVFADVGASLLVVGNGLRLLRK